MLCCTFGPLHANNVTRPASTRPPIVPGSSRHDPPTCRVPRVPGPEASWMVRVRSWGRNSRSRCKGRHSAHGLPHVAYVVGLGLPQIGNPIRAMRPDQSCLQYSDASRTSASSRQRFRIRHFYSFNVCCSVSANLFKVFILN